MLEEWKVIKGFSWYEVSNLGRIRRIKTDKILKLNNNSHGYLSVGLTNDIGKHLTKCVHRLVAEHFVVNLYPSIYSQVNHINENKHDNCYTNLEWCTQQYNHDYGTRNIRTANKLKGQKSKRAIKIIVYKDDKYINTFNSIVEASKYLNISDAGISAALRRDNKIKGYKVLKTPN